MKPALSIVLLLAAAGNLATNYALDGTAQIAASVASGLVVVACATGLIVLARRGRRGRA